MGQVGHMVLRPCAIPSIGRKECGPKRDLSILSHVLENRTLNRRERRALERVTRSKKRRVA
jgi:hypothetical protein